MSSEAAKTKAVAEAYQFKPAGHTAPAPKRKYAKPDTGLALTFEKWLARLPGEKETMYENDLYNNARLRTRTRAFSIDDVHSLLIRYQDHPRIKDAGLFISACYNYLPDKVITYDLDEVSPNILGYRLARDKILINKTKVGAKMGCEAEGAVVNFGAAEIMGAWSSGILINYKIDNASFGQGLSGLSINCGKVGHPSGQHSGGVMVNYGEAGMAFGFLSRGLVINCGKAGSFFGSLAPIVIAVREPEEFEVSKHKIVLEPEDCKKMPKLLGYLDELKSRVENGRTDLDELLVFLDELGPNPRKKVEQDLIWILGDAGYDAKLSFWDRV